MKKVVIFVHGEVFPEYQSGKNLHKDYEKAVGERIVWRLINGHLNKDDKNFPRLLKELESADIFLCDSDNTNLGGEIENVNFEGICHEKLVNALKNIREKKPHLKTFIVDFPYISREEMRVFSEYGTLIDYWLDDKTIRALKK